MLVLRRKFCALYFYKEEIILASMKKTLHLNEKKPLRLGIDIGSTTIKLAVLDQKDNLVFHKYLRHYANLRETLKSSLQELYNFLDNQPLYVSITGSGSLDISKDLDIPFIQEVTAGYKAIERFMPDASVVIEIGGEDSKIT